MKKYFSKRTFAEMTIPMRMSASEAQTKVKMRYFLDIFGRISIKMSKIERMVINKEYISELVPVNMVYKRMMFTICKI